ncbi:MAG: ATP synthase subunit I [Desulfobulbus sp.]|jgi:hypothetical protein|nr:ATP synthase subunit I [Desulfobulbus sp.]
MTDRAVSVGESNTGSETGLVRSVMIFSWILTLVLAAVGWYAYGWIFARSVFVGGCLVNSSFLLLRFDARRLTSRISVAGEQQGAVSQAETVRFIIHFFTRLVVLGLLMFVLASKMTIDVIGLTLGLTTVMCSIVTIGLIRKTSWLPSKV